MVRNQLPARVVKTMLLVEFIDDFKQISKVETSGNVEELETRGRYDNIGEERAPDFYEVYPAGWRGERGAGNEIANDCSRAIHVFDIVSRAGAIRWTPRYFRRRALLFTVSARQIGTRFESPT